MLVKDLIELLQKEDQAAHITTWIQHGINHKHKKTYVAINVNARITGVSPIEHMTTSDNKKVVAIVSLIESFDPNDKEPL